LFDFPVGFDGNSWLLLVKDQYDGKFYGWLLKNKGLIAVLGALKPFEAWTRRQFGLSICKIRQDNDTSVIGINGSTEYEKWCTENGIDIEGTPSHTHQPNGGAERAGKEIIEKSIKMRLSANLPEELWTEATMAAITLYNMSPAARKGFKSPNEIFHAWFRQYFRYYDPKLIQKLSTDIRPDWSNIWAYGCRAYPMIKDREALQQKRAFKVNPRAHLGYLVGYVSSNIYRVWVPQLQRVIVTRNVAFNESLFYLSSLNIERVVG
jgi:hypothetical protein